MKQTRELHFETLEKRELLASDFGQFASSHSSRDMDGPALDEFRRESHSRSDSMVALERGIHSRPMTISGHSNIASRHSPVSYIFERPTVTIEFRSTRPQTSPAEGEASSLDRPEIFQPPQPLERTISIIVLSDRPVSATATNAALNSIASVAQEKFIPTSLRASNEIKERSLVQNASQSYATLAPRVEPPSEIGSKEELLRNQRNSDASPTDQAFIESVLEADQLPHDVSNSHQPSSKIPLEVPSPTGMITLGLDSGFFSHNPSMNDKRFLRKTSVGSLDNADLRRDTSNRTLSLESVAKLEAGLPIPAGMIYLDFATRFLSQPDTATPQSRAVLQAGINPLALIQAFVTSQPIAARVQSQGANASDPAQDLGVNSGDLTWSSVGVIAALSGFFFAITPRWTRKARADRRRKIRALKLPIK